MNTASAGRTRRRLWATAGIATVSALLLVGCSSGSTASPTKGATSPSAASSDLEQQVADFMKAGDSYPVPTEAVSNPTALKGKTVFYIPITAQAPKFAIVQAGLKDALTILGAKLQACDGGGTPTTISTCINQAVAAHAAAIVSDAIYYDLAANAFDKAQAAGIPVLNTNQGPADGHPASDTLSYAVEAGDGGATALAAWVALDSEGKGTVLANVSVDGPAPKRYFAGGQKLLDQECPGCTVVINEITASNFSQIPSSTSSALLKNPDTGYVWSQFEQYLQVTQAGAQQAGRATDTKGLTGATTLGGLKQLAAKNFLYAAVADASTFNGWIDADAALRMVAGDAIPEYTIPERLFTRDNIGDITLTDDAQASGEWFGPTDFPDQFATLWQAD